MVFGARNEKEKRNKGRGEEAREETREEEARQEAGPRTIPLFSLSPPLSRLLPSLFFFFFLFLLSSLLSFLSLFLGKKKGLTISTGKGCHARAGHPREGYPAPLLPYPFTFFKTTMYDTTITNQLSNRILRFLFSLLSEQIIFLIILLRQTRSKLTARFCISLPQYLNSLT